MEEGARRREAQSAPAHRFVDELAHRRDVVRRRGLLAEAALSHDVVAHSAVADHPTDVHALGHLVDAGEVLAVGDPVPRQALEDGRRRDVLDGLHHQREVLAIVRTARRERHAAVAHHDGRHAVPARRRSDRIPRELRVEMGVDVDEPGCDDAIGRVDLDACSLAVQVTDRRHSIAEHADVGPHHRRSGAVDHGAIAHDQVERRHRPPHSSPTG